MAASTPQNPNPNNYRTLDELLWADEHPNGEPMPGTAATAVATAPTAPLSVAAPVDSLSAANLTAKLQLVADASRIKLAQLDSQRAAIAAHTSQMDAMTAADANSWVGKLGLDPNGVVGSVVNAAAGVIAGGSRQLVGATAALPYTAESMATDASITQADTDAYNRYVQGKATPEDMIVLNSRRNLAGNGVTGFAAAKASMDGNVGPTVMELVKHADATRQVARSINDSFNIDSIEHGATKDRLGADLSAGFKDSLAKFNSGDTVGGITGLLTGAGSAAWNNPRGVLQYVAENAPQLLVGGAGVAGKAGMTASNIGYAADYYQQGIENYAKQNGGQLPDNNERGKIAAWAASLAVAENLGDHIGVHAMQVVKPVVKEGEQGLKATLKAALNNSSLARTGAAALEGALGETATEGYQGYAEDVTSGKRKWNDLSPDALENIYTNAVIGGMSGGLLSGGVHTLAEATGATPEKAAERAQQAEKAAAFQEAVKNNDASTFLDPQNKLYNPPMALGAMLQHNLSANSTPESRDANFQKATEVMDQLSNRAEELKQQIKTGTQAEVKSAQTELKQINDHAKLGQMVWNKMFDELMNSSGQSDVQSQVEQANTPVKAADPVTTEQAQQAADNVINLSMASRDHLTADQADALASNTDNTLTEDQRGFLRTFSAARLAENALTTMGKVARTVLNGDDKNLGIAQYRTRIGMALASGNADMAQKQLDMLTNFATSHAEKAAVAEEAFKKYGESGQVYKTDAGWGYAAPGTYSAGKLRAGGGLPMVKPSLISSIKAEATALAATRDEMKYAVTLKFGPKSSVASPLDLGVQSTPSVTPTQASPAAQPAATPTPSQNEGQGNNNSPQGNVKDGARLESTTPETVAGAPHSLLQEPASIPAEVASAASPQSSPASPIAADAAQATATPSAPAVDPQTLNTNLVDGQKSTEMTNNQQAAVEQQAEPSVASEAHAAETAPATVAVEAIAEKAGKDAPYTEKKLGDFFTQNSSVLGRIKNLISTHSVAELGKLAGFEQLTARQQAALHAFTVAAKGWNQTIKDNVLNRNKPQYNYEDAMQYFIRPDGSIEENVLTAVAYAAFSYVAENFGRTHVNSGDNINQILGRQKGTPVTPDEYKLMRNVMASQPAVISALGQRVVAALGLETKPGTPINEMARLQAGLGAHAFRLLTDGEHSLVSRKAIPAEMVSQMLGKGKKIVDTEGIDDNSDVQTTLKADPMFIEMNYKDGKLAPAGEYIVKNSRDSNSAVNRLFAIEDAARPPSFEPVTKLRPFLKRTRQLVPSFLQAVIKKLNAQPNYLRMDKLAILGEVGDEHFLTMMGVQPVDEAVHAANRDPLTAKNDGLKRELENIKEFMLTYLDGDLSKPFYFDHYAMKQQRVGIANNMVNPQLSKIHRFMVYRQSWVSNVDTTNQQQLENFFLRVAEGLGVKTDKNDRATALAQFNEKFNSPEIQAGIAALNKIHDKQALTDEEKNALVKAVDVGGEAAHSLDALTGLAAYSRLKEGETSFEVNMLAEVDGVTNGPMLSHLLMGAASSIEQLFSMLNRGGFYQVGSSFDQFNDWRSTSGNMDLYEATTMNTLDRLNWMIGQREIDGSIKNAVEVFMGKLRDDATGAVLKDGRNMIKTPLTAMVYGSGIRTAIEGMADDFVKNIYGRIEKTYALRETSPAEAVNMHAKTVQALRKLGIQVPEGTGIAEMMELAFDNNEYNQLVGQFMETFGKAVDATIRADFKALLDNRQQFNSLASLTFEMYNAAYESLRKQLIDELVQKGEIAATSKGTPLHDFTPAQQKILDMRLAAITPTLQTAMSNLSDAPAANTGMLVAKTGETVDTTLPYKNQVHYKRKFADTKTSTLYVYGRRRTNADPGVGLGATSTHSFDSAVSHSAIAGREVLNLHDAHGTSITDLVNAGKRLNKALWDRAMEYSPAQEMYDSYIRTLKGIEALLNDANTPTDLLVSMGHGLVAQSGKSSKWDATTKTRSTPIPATTILMARAIEAKRLAYDAARIQYGAMAQMQSVAQYAVEGGNYEVTDADRAVAQAKLEAATPTMSEADMQLVQSVQDRLKDAIQAAMLNVQEGAKNSTSEPMVSPFGTKGKPAVESDLAVVNHFRKKPVQSVAEVAAFLKTRNLTGFQQKLLASLVKALGARAANYQVKLVTGETKPGDVLENATVPSHAWFVSKGGQNDIYLLAPEFKESGLTVETVLHELVHAAVAHAITTPTADTQPLIDELEKLRQQMVQIVADAKLGQFAAAVASVQEMVAYGMTDAAFQALLDSHLMETQNGSNKWISGLKAFIDSLVGLIFAKKNESASSGLTVLVTNVAGLMHASSQSAQSQASQAYINQSMAAPLESLTGEQMYEELGKLSTVQVSPEFDAKLRGLLGRLEESVHSPLSAMKLAAQQTMAQTPLDLWDYAKNNGLALFGKSALASGFPFSEQEAFALEQVEATVRTALQAQDGSTAPIYRELARLYNEVRVHLTGRINDLHPDPKEAQALYDFIFKMEAGNGNRADYLSRFAALGLTNERFSKLLDFDTKVTPNTLAGKTFAEKLHALFELVMSWLNGKLTNTFEGQKADAKLQALVNQLAYIEQVKRMKLSQAPTVIMDTFEQLFRDGVDKGRKGLENLGNSRFFKQSSNGVIRMTGRIVAVAAADRLGQYLNAVQTFRDKYLQERNGVMMGLVDETRGAHAGNAMFHKLLRLTKRNEGVRKDLITNTAKFVLDGFHEGGKYLTDFSKAALSAVVLRTDLASLLADDRFSLDQIRQLVSDRIALKQATMDMESRLAGLTHAQSYMNGAKALGLFLASGEVGAANLRFNPENIANMLGTAQANTVTAEEVAAAVPLIDQLATLYALGYSHTRDLDAIKDIFNTEATRTDGGNGIETTLKLHKQLQKDSAERLFKSSDTLRMKGYTPEIYNPYIRIEVADGVSKKGHDNKTDGERLEERGYSESHSTLTMDDADPGQNDNMRIYKLRDGGLVQYLTGIFSYTGQRRRGTATHNGDLGLLSVTGMMNRQKMQKIMAGQTSNMTAQATGPIDPKVASQNKNYLVPVFNSQGEVVNYRYMMSHATKDGLLERDNRFEQLLGVMEGNTFDKEVSAEQNRKAVQALRDQYLQDFAKNPGSYLEVGPNSRDQEAREVWNLLPEDTRQAVRDIWGTNGMMVRYDMLDMNFGYRKLSAAAPFGIPEHERTNFEQAWVSLMEGLFGKKAGLYVRRTEDIWQALVREAKDTMVVKSGATLLGNFTSNVSELIWFGVPLADIWKHHRVALKGILAYRKDTKELASLEKSIQLNQLAGKDRKEVERRIVQLKDGLARNPVRELVEAGLMPTIVEDVSQDEDRYSYKGQFTRKVDEVVGNLNPHVLKAGKYLVMAHDTPMYKALSYGTQVSDFIARYTLYQHVINRAKNPMDAQTAVQLVSDAFVNYDVPSHRTVQYANDMGLVYFSKYYLRIQKVIALLYKNNPGRAMMLLTMGHFLDFIPMLTHSAVLHRIGNPFSTGAFEAVSSLNEMLTLNSLLTPFR